LALSAFGDARSIDQSIESITLDVMERGEKCRTDIEALPTYSQSHWDAQAITAAQQSAAARLQTLISAFRVSQQAFLTKRGQYSPQADLLSDETTEQDDPENAEIEEMTDTQVWKERSQDVDSLLQNFSTLAEIFRELNHLVVQQGNILDRIDVNIELSKEETSKAVTELGKVVPK